MVHSLDSKARSINDCQSDVPNANDSWDENVSHPGDDDAGDGDLDAGPLEEFVPEVHPVPEGDDVPLDGNVVFPMKPGKGQHFKCGLHFELPPLGLLILITVTI